MITVNHLDSENQSPENKTKLARAISNYLEYSPERKKQIPVPPSTVHTFHDKFMEHTYRRLFSINPDINKSFTVKLAALKELIAKNPQAKYIKITLVQIPDKFEPKISNPELKRNSKNLYLLFTLANSHNTPHLCGYYDLNCFNENVCAVHDNDVQILLKEFNSIEKPGSIRKEMLEITPKNTEHIYVHISQMQNDFIPTMEKNCATYISLVFCEIDESDKATREMHYSSLIKNNHNHFGCLWIGINQYYRVIPQIPVYDFNSLCPNMCPES